MRKCKHGCDRLRALHLFDQVQGVERDIDRLHDEWGQLTFWPSPITVPSNPCRQLRRLEQRQQELDSEFWLLVDPMCERCNDWTIGRTVAADLMPIDQLIDPLMTVSELLADADGLLRADDLDNSVDLDTPYGELPPRLRSLATERLIEISNALDNDDDDEDEDDEEEDDDP